jgi:hypothetical protein
MIKLPEYELMYWDWKDVPDLGDFTMAARKGFTYFQYLPPTTNSGDDYIVIATKVPVKLTKAQAYEIYKQFYGEE